MYSNQLTTQNLFTWLNPGEANFSYRRVPIDLPCLPGHQEDHHRQLQRIARHVGSATKGPAVILRDSSGQPFVAIPADRQLAPLTIRARPRPVVLASQSETYPLKAVNCTDQEWEVIRRFVEFEGRRQIKQTGRVVEDAAGRFFLKKPLPGLDHCNVMMLPGFSFRIVADGPHLTHFCLDVTYRYVDKKPLSKYVHAGNVAYMQKRLFRGANRKKGLPALYQMGDQWFPIRVKGFGGKISEEIIQDPNGKDWTVQNYVLAKTNQDHYKVKALMHPDDLTVYFTYPGKEMDTLSAPASLVLQLFKTGDPQVRGLHSRTILDSPVRFKFIERNIGSFFQALTFNGTPVRIAKDALTEDIPVVPMQALKFNKGKILNPSLLVGHGKTPLFELGKQRRTLLENVGILDQSTFDAQYLIVPDQSSMPIGLRQTFQKRLEQQLKALAPQFTGYAKVIPYKADVSLPATDLVNRLQSTLETYGIREGYALIVLPDWGRDDEKAAHFHDMIKKKHYPALKFQCANVSTIESYFELGVDDTDLGYHHPTNQQANYFKSYLFYLALEYLKLNRKFPYALADKPNYDIYVGIDVHDRFAGFTFFYRNGERIVFDYIPVTKKPSQQRAERLTTEQIYNKLYPTLKKHLSRGYCDHPNSIVLLRDGRSHGGETAALLQTIKQLQQDGLIRATEFDWGVVDVHKTSQCPFRAATPTPGARQYDRPAAGTFKLLGRQRRDAFLFPTGEPFKTRGSAKPLHLSLVDGSIALDRVVADVFGQCLLAFSAPDRACSLPISIKLLDAFLDPMAVPESLWTGNEDDEEADEHVDLWNEEFTHQLEQAP